MKRKIKKLARKPMTKNIAFMMSDKLYKKVKRIMKQQESNSLSAAIRTCIEAY